MSRPPLLTSSQVYQFQLMLTLLDVHRRHVFEHRHAAIALFKRNLLRQQPEAHGDEEPDEGGGGPVASGGHGSSQVRTGSPGSRHS